MLLSMRVVSPGIRLALVMLAALAMLIAAPLHASHHHGNEPGKIDGPCAVCKSYSPASGSVAVVCTGLLLLPLGVLASDASVAPLSTPDAIVAPRAPPVSFA